MILAFYSFPLLDTYADSFCYIQSWGGWQRTGPAPKDFSVLWGGQTTIHMTQTKNDEVITSGSEGVLRRERGQHGSVVLKSHAAMSRDICDLHKWVGVFLVFKDAIRHSVMHRIALHNKELSGLKY